MGEREGGIGVRAKHGKTIKKKYIRRKVVSFFSKKNMKEQQEEGERKGEGEGE
jgi:hypothetical protein